MVSLRDSVTVLHVADEPRRSSLVATHLEREAADANLTVETTDRPAEALSRVEDESSPVDCVVVDDGTPEMDGLSLLRAVRAARPNLPFVLHAETGSEAAARDAFRVGATDYVRNDSETDRYAVLADRVLNAVLRHRARMEARRDDTASDSLRDVTHQRQRRETARYRAKLKDVVLDTSTTLMSAELDEVETKVHWTLQSLGEVLDADRCTVSRYDEDADALRKMNEWAASDADAQPASVTAEDCPWVFDRLRQFEEARSVAGTTLPPEASGLDAAFEVPGDTAFVAVPMVSNWSLSGAVTFVSEEPRPWPDEEVSLLRTAADVLSHTMERRRREEELHRQNERLEEFASVVSHDLRNPLNVADGFVELARETGNVAHLDRAKNALDRMNVLVNDVLELARQGRTVGDTSPVDVGALAERAWRAVDTGDAALSVSDSLGVVSADGGRLSQAMENLFRNAVEHNSAESRPPDAVTVSVGSLDDGLGFYVEDDGPGIPEADRETVFEHGHTTSEQGSGFGLSIVESIVEAHGWDVRVTASSEGGARFEIRTTAPAAEFETPAGPPGSD